MLDLEILKYKFNLKIKNIAHVGVNNGKEVVSLKKFDSLFINNVKFMSIDTQGYDLEVLKGSNEYLNSIDYLIVEINRKYLYKNSPLEKDIDLYLKPFGFIRAVTSYWGKECVWGDSFYIKKIKFQIN